MIALVIGAASGIGEAICRELSCRSATVISADFAEHADFHVDVRDRESVAELFRTVLASHSRIDLVINTAGVLSSGSVDEFADTDWCAAITVNTLGTIWVALEAYRIMRGQGAGSIVNVASLSALNPPPFFLPYVTSKYGVLGFSLGLRAEAKRHGVNVSVVCPGNVDTPMLRRAII